MASRFNRDKLENPTAPASRLGQEIELLRAKIADLESLESELTKAEQALVGAGSAAPFSAGQIRSEIKKKLGYFPISFSPPADFPASAVFGPFPA